MFIDQAKIVIRSGKGGNGVIQFRREKYVPRGGPDGGDGGKGGDVVIVVDARLNTLFSFRNSRLYRAEEGSKGGGSNMTGKSGVDLELKVPPGTILYDDDSGEVIGDLLEVGQRLVVAQGGRGGRGNARFASPRNKAPRTAEKGAPAEEKNLRLELKLIADVGIVGVPNAGKSTLLSVVTNAKPKIADYPFTTLQPNLGVASLDEYTSLVLADIPGLIEGAHTGVGLGHDFLRHVQRNRILIHILDGTAEDPFADMAQINSELALFDEKLGDKPQLVVINKIDLPDVEARLPELKKKLKARGIEPLVISAVAGTNIKELLFKAAKLLAETPEPEAVVEMPVYRPETDPNQFSIAREPNGWRVSGVAIERAAAMTYWEYDQSIRRFQRILDTLGIVKALREAGISPGDIVMISDYELEWEE